MICAHQPGILPETQLARSGLESRTPPSQEEKLKLELIFGREACIGKFGYAKLPTLIPKINPGIVPGCFNLYLI